MYMLSRAKKTVGHSNIQTAPVKIESFNCRGMNDIKKWYV